MERQGGVGRENTACATPWVVVVAGDVASSSDSNGTSRQGVKWQLNPGLRGPKKSLGGVLRADDFLLGIKEGRGEDVLTAKWMSSPPNIDTLRPVMFMGTSPPFSPPFASA